MNYTGEDAIYEDDRVSVGLFDLRILADAVEIRSSIFGGVLPPIKVIETSSGTVWLLRFYEEDGRVVPYKPLLRDLEVETLRDMFLPILQSNYVARFVEEGERVKSLDDLVRGIRHPALEPSRYAFLEILGKTDEPYELLNLHSKLRRLYAQVYPTREKILNDVANQLEVSSYERVGGEWQIMNTPRGKILCSREVGSKEYALFLIEERYSGELPTFTSDPRMGNAPFVSGTVPDLSGDHVFLGYYSDWKRILENLERVRKGPKVLITMTEDLSPKEEEVMEVLYRYKRAILIGPPGTGKTYVAQRVAERIAGREGWNWVLVQASPSLRYEEFVEGLRPVKTSQGVAFEVQDGIFLRIVKRAKAHPTERFMVILDEMNRGNLPAILGNLLYAIEYRGRPVILPYSGSSLVIPDNLLFLGTLNERDVTTLQIDQAILRRFPVVFFEPDEEELRAYLRGKNWSENQISWAIETFRKLNRELKNSLGHAYFFASTPQDLRRKLRYFVLPLLRLRLGKDLEDVLEDVS
ncbi:MAG: AAA domain-containing protein [Thermotogae bacterium]|nr:AAA domain-containing protein [Thermotogota bacterium]